MDEILVNQTTAGSQDQPSVAGFRGTQFVAVWEDNGTANIKGRLFGANGAPTSNEFMVNFPGDPGTKRQLPKVIETGQGFAVTWNEQAPGGLFQVQLRTFDQGDDGAWQAAREEVDAGNPVLLLTDLYYLDHYGNSAHFPGHAVVLAGYDDEHAHLSDTGFEQLQTTTRLEDLDRARHSGHPAYPLSGHMFTASGGVTQEQLRAAIPAAIERAAQAMVASELGELSGLDAVERLAREAGSWPEVAEDWQWCARFGYQVIERRGTGGGAFRLMYSHFLEETGRPEAPLAAEAAARWTELAGAFHAASERDDPEPGLWREIDSAAHRVAEAEQRLWTALA